MNKRDFLLAWFDLFDEREKGSVWWRVKRVFDVKPTHDFEAIACFSNAFLTKYVERELSLEEKEYDRYPLTSSGFTLD